MENKIKTRRRKDRKPSKIYHFRFETDLKDRFVKKAEEAGYNTTEALELLMQKAIEGLLPKKVSIQKKIDERIQGISEETFAVLNTKDKFFDGVPVFTNNELVFGKVNLKKTV